MNKFKEEESTSSDIILHIQQKYYLVATVMLIGKEMYS